MKDTGQDIRATLPEGSDDVPPGIDLCHRRHGAGKRAVTRTDGTTPDPVRYMYTNRPPGPPAAH